MAENTTGSLILARLAAARAAAAGAQTPKPEPAQTGIVPQDAPPREQPVITRPGDVVSVAELVTEESDDEEAPVVAVHAVAQAPASSPGKRGRPSKEEMARRAQEEQDKFNAAVQAEVNKRLGPGNSKALDNALVQAADDANEYAERCAKLQAELERVKASIEDEVKKRVTGSSVNRVLEQQAQEIKELKAAKPGAPVQDGLTLFIDTYPVKGQPEGLVDFYEWIGPIAAVVAESASVADYRLIQYTSKGLLAQAMREVIKAEGLPKAMTIGSMAPGADVALEILIPFAKRVYRKI